MATSGKIDTAIKSWLTLRLSWSVTSQSVANNSSVVNVKAQLITSGGNINSTASKDITMVINGTSYSGTCKVGIEKNTTKTLMEKDVTVAHGVDGTKTFSMTCVLDMNVTLSLSWVGKVSVSGSGTLPAIARVSTFTRTGDPYLGKKQTFTISRKASSFTHTIKYKTVFGDDVATIATGVGTSYEWTPPLSLASKFLNSLDYDRFTITLETYSGSTLVGTSNLTFDMYLSSTDGAPDITGLILTEYVEGIAEHYGGFLDTKSRIKYKVEATPKYGATINRCHAIFGNKTYNGSENVTGVINTGDGTKTVRIAVYDSREFMTMKDFTYEVLPYSPPTFKSLNVQRCTPEGVLDDQGEALKLSISYRVTPALAADNQNGCFLSYKLMDETYYTSLPFDYTTDSYDGAVIVKYPTASFSAERTYHVRVQLRDFFGVVASVLVLPSMNTVLDIMYTDDGVALGKTAEVPGLFDIGYKTRFYGGIQPMYIQDATDLNDVILPGYYASRDATSAGLANAPTPTGTFTLEVLGAGISGQVMQRITVCNKTAPSTFVRHFYGGSWGAWVQIF